MASSGSIVIYQTVLSCLGAFRKCLSHPELYYFEDQLGRFNLWATNINAASTSRSSLDSRLRGSDKTSNMVVQLLRALQVNLEYSVQLIERQGNISQDDDPGGIKDGSTISSGDQSVSTSSSSSDSRLSGQQGGKRKTLVKPVAEIVDQVQGIISRLHQMSRAIRKASQQDRALKIARFEVKNADDIEQRDDLTEHVRWLLDHYHPQSDPELRIRLLNGILLRQKRFFYRKSRRKGIRAHSFPLPKIPEVMVAALPPIAQKPQSVTNRQERIESQAPRSNADRSVAQTQNTVSAFDENLFTPDAAPSRQPAMSVRSTRQDKDLDWPAPPKRQRGTIETECPYCFDVLAEDEISDIKLWRQHVKRDLEPYNCYFEGCQDPIKTFKEFRQWLEHIKDIHTPREWLCTVKSHTPYRFLSEQDFRKHMLSEHRDTFTDSQLEMLARINSKPLTRPFSICPLCDGYPDDCPTIEDQESKGLSDNLPRHIAGHLKSLAMLSLPARADVERTNEVTVAGDRRAAGDSNADSTSLVFSDPPLLRTIETEGTLAVSEVFSFDRERVESTTIFDPDWTNPDMKSIPHPVAEDIEGVSDPEVDDIWGISALICYPDYPGGQANDPTLAAFRERAILFSEETNDQEDQELTGENAPTNAYGLRILSLDNGGIYGIGELLVIEYTMLRLKDNLHLSHIPIPAQYFDYIVGSGTGGIIAILLGRLRLDIKTAIATFSQILETIAKTGSLRGHEFIMKLQSIIVSALGEGRGNESMMESNQPPRCKVFVCAAKSEDGQTKALLITNSTESVRRPFECTIVEAIMATMASPGVFEPVLIKYGEQIEIIYGPSEGYNNPTDAVLLLVQNSSGIDEVACILNIGSGYDRDPYFREGMYAGVIEENLTADAIMRCQEIIQDAEDSARMVEEQMLSLQMTERYFRLNIGNSNVDWRSLDALREITEKYLSTETVANKVSMLVDKLIEPLGRDEKVTTPAGGLSGALTALKPIIGASLEEIINELKGLTTSEPSEEHGGGEDGNHLFTVFNDSKEAAIDIVYVQAISRDDISGWTAIEPHLQHSLSGDKINARTLTYRYRIDFDRASVQKYADDLETRLIDARVDSAINRPIIFLGQGFGGLIVLQTLRKDNLRIRNLDLLKVTQGVMLLGDPIGRLPTADWALSEDDLGIQRPTEFEDDCILGFLGFLNECKQRYRQVKLHCFFQSVNTPGFSLLSNQSVLNNHYSTVNFEAPDYPGLYKIYPELRKWIEDSKDGPSDIEQGPKRALPELLPDQAVNWSYGTSITETSSIQQAGMTELCTNPQAVIDIVLIHDLGGHPRETWTAKNGRFWPTELLLPTLISKLPQIYVYGYESSVQISDNIANLTDVHGHARGLLTDLSTIRTRQKRRRIPLLFVAHGFGGLIVKRALEMANDYVNKTSDIPLPQGSQYIIMSTYGILFLGTPNDSSDPDHWKRCWFNLICGLRGPLTLQEMAAQISLRQIDELGKKFSEGVTVAESISVKLQQSTNAAERDRLQEKLKGVIKQLQKLQDQVKTWPAVDNTNDSGPLFKYSNALDRQIEKFVAIDVEIDKLNAYKFLDTIIEDLRVRSTVIDDGVSLPAEAAQFWERSKWHLEMLMLTKKKLHRGLITINKFNDLRDAIESYSDFTVDNKIYDDLDLGEEEEIHSMDDRNDPMDIENADSGSESGLEMDIRALITKDVPWLSIKLASSYQTNPVFQSLFQSHDRVFQQINLRFLDIIQQFRVAMVYEAFPTNFAFADGSTISELVVDQATASPPLPEVLRFGMQATHADMCKFEEFSDQGYLLISDLLHNWAGHAPGFIGNRWEMEHAGSTWRWERVSCYRTHKKDVKDYLINLFGEWDFYLEIHEDDYLFYIPRSLTESEKDEIRNLRK